MRLTIRRLPSEKPSYSIDTGSGIRYGVQPIALKRWLLKLGVGDSTIAKLLDIQSTKTATIEIAKAA